MSLDHLKDLKPDTRARYSYPQTHPYRGSRVYQLGDGRVVLESWMAPETPTASSDRYTAVGAGEEGRLDIIAYRLYGSAKWWWVLAVMNDIMDPFEEVTSGMALRYPSLERFFSEIVTGAG